MALENKLGLTSLPTLPVRKNESARRRLWNFLKKVF